MPLQYTWKGVIEGSGGHQGTIDIFFPPQTAVASIAIYQTIGDGRSAIGIRSIEYRDTPTGPNKLLDFSPYYWLWPPHRWHPLMTKVTFGISQHDNTCRGIWTVDFYS